MNYTTTTTGGWNGYAAPPVVTLQFSVNTTPALSPDAPPLGDAVKVFLAVWANKGYRPSYVASLRHYLNMFARTHAWPVTGPDLERWFATRRESPVVARGNRGRLSAFFGFCRRRRWITENPCDYIERPRIEPSTPAILSLDHCRRLMDTARFRVPSLLPYMTLALFAGIRPNEIRRLTWADVDLDGAHVTVAAAASKVHRRRVVPLEPVALEWLRLADRNAPLVPQSNITFRRHRRKLAKRAGHWPQDALRHTGATYLLAKYQEPGKVALWLGNSERMLRTHYADLVGAGDVAAFWSLSPTPAPGPARPKTPACPPLAVRCDAL